MATLLVIVTVFVVRVKTGNIITEASDGQMLKLANQYIMGGIYDRNGEEIVVGEKEGPVWAGGEETEKAFSELISTDISETINSKMTIAGMGPWIFGLEDNMFEWDDFLQPWKQRVGGNIRLTIEKELQLFVQERGEQLPYKNMSVVVSNWKTGEVYVALGEVFSEMHHVGSTIKPILAAAVLEINPELIHFTYDCVEANHTFHTENGPYRIACYNDSSHGLVDMETAIAKSCNGYFVALLQQVPREKLQEVLTKWGFDTSVSYEQFMYWDHDFLSESQKSEDYLLAAIGQANVKMTVMGLHMCTSAILNQGVLQEPFLVEAKAAEADDPWETLRVDKQHQFCYADVADITKNMMLQVTLNGTGQSFYLPGFAAKTGTATNADGSNTVLTTGGLVQEETPYCITVCMSGVGNEVSSGVAGKMSKEILQYMLGGNE